MQLQKQDNIRRLDLRVAGIMEEISKQKKNKLYQGQVDWNRVGNDTLAWFQFAYF
jgi:hypothetical protein